MSMHIDKRIRNGREEWFVWYPGMSKAEAQTVADAINKGAIQLLREHEAKLDEEVTK